VYREMRPFASILSSVALRGTGVVDPAKT